MAATTRALAVQKTPNLLETASVSRRRCFTNYVTTIGKGIVASVVNTWVTSI
jgi:hypothetical protein